MPPSAISSLPFFCTIAPVNAPFSWPNSSLSSSVSASAAQLMATNGPAARRLLRWIARATSSLPVPLSPRISTVELDGATLAIWRCSSRIFALTPTMSCSSLELRLQALVLLLQPAQNGGVLPGDRRHAGHCGQQAANGLRRTCAWDRPIPDRLPPPLRRAPSAAPPRPIGPRHRRRPARPPRAPRNALKTLRIGLSSRLGRPGIKTPARSAGINSSSNEARWLAQNLRRRRFRAPRAVRGRNAAWC